MLEEKHLPRRTKMLVAVNRFSCQTVKIDPRRYQDTLLVFAVPIYLFVAGLLLQVPTAYLSAGQIVDHQSDMAGFGQIITDCSGGVEGVVG